MAVAEAEPVIRKPSGLVERVRALLGSTGENALTQRLAGTIFVIRVLSAGLAYASQVLLARWLGSADYGIYVYVWTWVLLLGSMMDYGTSVSAQKFVAEYRVRNENGLLRGFIFGSRWMTFAVASVISLLLAALVWSLSTHIDRATVIPLYLGCLTLPPFVVANVQDGIARAYDWMRLALMPQFIVRQSLIIVFTALVFLLGSRLSAADAMNASNAAVWLAMIGQLILLNRRLSGAVEPGERAYAIRTWLATSLPILIVESFYLLLSYIDVLVLQYYRPSDDVGIYYSVVKTLALISFVHYAMAASTAHRFSEYHTAGDHERLSAYLRHAIKWTFWPSLAATVALLMVGKPLLWLFGPQFTAGYPMMFILAVGLLARAAIGPIEKLMSMIGRQQLCAAVYAVAFVMNLCLCVLLVPHYGGFGAAASTALSLVFESILLFWIMRALGFHVLAFGNRKRVA